MKTYFFPLLFALCFPSLLWAQIPDGFNYQAVLRDANGAVLANQNVSLQFSILPGPPPATEIYQESHTAQTDARGLITLTVGQGTSSLGDFSTIDWASGPFFLNVALDETGGSNFTDLGAFQLLSVPFAMYARNAENVNDADADPANEIQTLGINGDTLTLSNGGSVQLPNTVSYIAGPGIGITGNVIENTSPDQAISLTGMGATVIGGTYPNFSITSTDNVNDADSDPANELQTISANGTDINLSNGGGSVSLLAYTAGTGINLNGSTIVNTAPDQTVSLSGTGATNVTGTYPNFTINSTDNVDDADSDPANELQTITANGTDIDLSNGGGSVSLLAYTAGNGISLNGNTIVNSAPDQNVNLSGTGATVVTGTYPNFTINSTDNVNDADSDPNNEIQTLTLSGNVLSLSGGNQVTIPQVSPWGQNGSNLFYNNGFVAINHTNPLYPLHVRENFSQGVENAVGVDAQANLSSGNFHRSVYGTVTGQTNQINSTFRGVQGFSAVNNLVPSGNNIATAGFADSSHNNYGVFGRAGELGDTTSGFNFGVYGQADGSTFINRGLEGYSNGDGLFNQGMFSRVDGTGDGSATSENVAIFGYSLNNTANNYSVLGWTDGTGTFNVGTYGQATGVSGTITNYGIYGFAANGGTNYAGFFQGDVNITGTLSKAGGTFKIDHPLDPANKYLVHSFVESPDMLNIYNGNVITDANGFATISLPEYFEAANKDFKYQLTVIGTFAQAIIAEKLQNNQFVIQTNQPNVEVSWQITGVRNDPWADQNRIVPEPVKTGQEAGRYLHPELYNQPEEMGIGRPRTNPESVQQPDVEIHNAKTEVQK